MSTRCVAVWEVQVEQGWCPLGPGVARLLERALEKSLTRAELADAEPALAGLTATLRPTPAVGDRALRRRLYPASSAPGRGARWGWRDGGALPMSVQVLLEEAGEARWAGWTLRAAGDAVRGTARRPLCRTAHQPYPLARGEVTTTAPPAPPAPSVAPLQPPASSTRDRRPHGLARQILQIFGGSGRDATSDADSGAESGESVQETARRHSVDTVSTYLSHESKDGLASSSTADLLDSSAEDEVFSVGGGARPAREEGRQPSGSLSWCREAAPLPGYPERGRLRLTFSFSSGTQLPGDPAPGRPYFAVGFPRDALLPDTPLGARAAALLRTAWERRVLFSVRASRTTGRDHVVSWSAALLRPPPAHPHHYHQLLQLRQHPDDTLRRLNSDLALLIHPL